MSKSSNNQTDAKFNRRQLMHGTALTATAAAAGVVSMNTTHAKADHHEKSGLKKGSTVLFQGDSITDAGRQKRDPKPNDHRSLANGYAFMIAAHLLANQPKDDLTFLNRGISGHKVPDLAKRWQRDTIDLKPDVLSILIGVNDIWHKLNGKYDGTVKNYHTEYSELIARTKRELPNTRIVICEPFVLRCGAVNDKWFPEFDQRRAAAKKVADQHKLTFVPFQQMFDDATKLAEPKHWAGDGVHPSNHGHALMASTWLKYTGYA